MSIILDTPESIEQWVFSSRMFQLAIEINTGLKHRGSVLADCQRRGWTNKRTKRGALADLVVIAKATRGEDWSVPDSVARALAA